MRITIPQTTYDLTIQRLLQHHKAHKGLSSFPQIKQGLERNAKVLKEGVEVDRNRLDIAADAIRDNIKFAGSKYSTAPDKSLLADIEEAIAEHEAKASLPVPLTDQTESMPAFSTEAQHVEPVQSLQQIVPEVVSLAAVKVEAHAVPKTYQFKTDYLNRKPLPVPSPKGPSLAEIEAQQAKRAALGPPPKGCEWWPDGSGGYEPMPLMTFADD